MRSNWFAGFLFVVLGSAGAPTLAQPSGGPPTDVFVEARLSANGIALTPAEIQLDRGAYYRLNLVCHASDQGDPNFTFETDPLVRNAHLLSNVPRADEPQDRKFIARASLMPLGS